MENNSRIMFDISNFEPVTEDSGNKLVGGFSASKALIIIAHPLDNAHNKCIGNCIAGCGGPTLNGTAGCSSN